MTEIFNELNDIITEFVNGMFKHQRVASTRKGREGFERIKTKQVTSMHIASKAKAVLRHVLSACTMHDMELVKFNTFSVVNTVRDLLSLYDMPQSALLVSLADLELGERVGEREHTVSVTSMVFTKLEFI